MTTTGWSPLPFALRLQSINRKKAQEIEALISSDMNQYNTPQQQPETPIQLPRILATPQKLQTTRVQKRPRLPRTRPPPPSPPSTSVSPYTEILWPPDRRRASKKRKRTRNNSTPNQVPLQSNNRSTSQKKPSRFLWLPYFRKPFTDQFTEIGQNPKATQQLYDAYVGQYSFAFNNAGIYYLQGAPSTRRFYAVAFDLDQARHRLIEIMRSNKAPTRLQEIFDATVDERNLTFHVVERISPFYKETVDTGVGSAITVKKARTFQEYRSLLFAALKTYLLKHNLDRVRKSLLYPVVWHIWQVHVRGENVARLQAALRIQVAWRRRQGGLALHMKRQAKRYNDEQTAMADKAIRTVQHWWSMKNGSFAAKMKARAAMMVVQEDQAIRKVQHWWSVKHGSFAAKMKARAEVLLKLEEEDTQKQVEQCEQAARRIQSAWRRKTGQMARHLLKQAKKQLKEELKLELKAAHTIHVW